MHGNLALAHELRCAALQGLNVGLFHFAGDQADAGVAADLGERAVGDGVERLRADLAAGATPAICRLARCRDTVLCDSPVVVTTSLTLFSRLQMVWMTFRRDESDSSEKYRATLSKTGSSSSTCTTSFLSLIWFKQK